MRYNPDTERGISLDAIAEQCRNAILRDQPTPNSALIAVPTRAWDCQRGGWTTVLR